MRNPHATTTLRRIGVDDDVIRART